MLQPQSTAHILDPDSSQSSFFKGTTRKEKTTSWLVLCLPDGNDVGEQEEEADDL